MKVKIFYYINIYNKMDLHTKYLKYVQKNKSFKQLGGDCIPPPDPDSIEPGTLDNYSTIPANRLITINNTCYDIEILARWINTTTTIPLRDPHRNLLLDEDIWNIITTYNRLFPDTIFHYTLDEATQVDNDIDIGLAHNLINDIRIRGRTGNFAEMLSNRPDFQALGRDIADFDDDIEILREIIRLDRKSREVVNELDERVAIIAELQARPDFTGDINNFQTLQSAADEIIRLQEIERLRTNPEFHGDINNFNTYNLARDEIIRLETIARLRANPEFHGDINEFQTTQLANLELERINIINRIVHNLHEEEIGNYDDM